MAYCARSMGRVHIVVDQVEALAERFVEELAAAAHKVNKRPEGRLRVALSGGSAAQHLLPKLVGAPLSGSGVEIYFCDERAVALDDERSNHLLVRRLWTDPAAIPLEQLHPFYDVQVGTIESARRYDALIKDFGGRFDAVLLGVGPDGHVASLFPGMKQLNSARLAEAVEDAPKPPSERVTLTLGPLSSSRCVIVAAFGQTKADILRLALLPAADELVIADQLPLRILLKHAPASLLLLDPEAAAGIGLLRQVELFAREP